MGRFIDLTGQKFNRLIVVNLQPTPKGKPLKWECLCDCGNTVITRGSSLKNNHTRSCGCYNKERVSETVIKNKTTHGMVSSSEYSIWSNMKQRCTNLLNTRYSDYGGRGITVCDRWKDSFENFYEDMGPKPSPGHSIDRIDVNGNYELINCKWSTVTEQNRNQRRCVIKDLDQANEIRERYKTGNYTQQELADFYGCTKHTIHVIMTNKQWKN
jgi:hypothetical protein